MKSSLLRLIKAGLFALPFIPLYISQSLFFPYITGKAFVFRIIVEIIFAAWIYLAVYHKEYRPKMSPILAALGIFIVVVSLATAFGINPVKSFWSNFERMEGLVAYLHLFAYFLVLTNVFQKSDWKIFFTLFVVSSIYENTYAFLQRMEILPAIQGGSYRVDGTIGNPTYLAAYLTFIFGFCVSLWLDAVEKWQKYFYGLMAAWALLTIYFTGTRGAVLGLIIGIFIFGLLYLILKKTESASEITGKRMILGCLLISLAIPVGIFFAKDRPFVKNNPTLARLTSLSFSERTIRSRFTIWGMGWEGVKERPVLGWGPENYAVVFSKYFQPELWRQEPWFDRSHNIVFDWLINAGFLGLLSYLSIFASAFYLLWKNYVSRYFTLEKSLLFVALLFAYFFQNLFVFDNFATYISFFGILGFIHYSYSESSAKGGNLNQADQARMEKSARKYPSGGDEISDALMPFGLVVSLVAVLYFVNISPLMANLSLLNALRDQSQNPEIVFGHYQKAFSYGYLGRQEAREQMVRFAIAVGSSPALPIDFKDKIIRATLLELDMGVKENPSDPRPYLFLGGLLNRVGLTDDALSMFNEAIRLSPKKQQIYFELADLYLQKGDYNNSVSVLEKAFDLDREYNQAAYNLVGAYILSGQQEKADKLMLESFGTVDVPNQILVQVYSSRQDYGRLVGVWKAFVASDPKSLDNRKSLAGAYLLAGDKNGAIRTLQEAIKDFPEFSAEGENLIRQNR